MTHSSSAAAFTAYWVNMQQNRIMQVAAFKWLMLAAIIIGFNTPTLAQDSDVGKSSISPVVQHATASTAKATDHSAKN